jgi:hypothetical protein
MKTLLFIIAIGTIVCTAGEKYRVTLSKNQDAVILTNAKGDSSFIYGHPTGETVLIGLIKDSLALVESGCCEPVWFFKVDLTSCKKYYYQPKHNALENAAANKMVEERGVIGLFQFLESNSHLIEIQSDSLFSDWSPYSKE